MTATKVTAHLADWIVGVKGGDIPAEVRVKAIQALVDNYFRADRVVQGGYPMEMRYAGPREGLLHAGQGHPGRCRRQDRARKAQREPLRCGLHREPVVVRVERLRNDDLVPGANVGE